MLPTTPARPNPNAKDKRYVECRRVTSSESTVRLLERAREGDQEALAAIFAREIPLLRRWASGRLPRWVRGTVDTDDLVQDTVIITR